MDWIETAVYTTTQGIEAVTGRLLGLGIDGFVIKDAQDFESFLEDKDTSVAPHWYIRHGARDRDTAFPIPVNFATKLQNTGRDVNFLLAWNRPHSGDYALDELFQWLQGILK